MAVPDDELSEMLGAGVTMPQAMFREACPAGRGTVETELSLSCTMVNVAQPFVRA